MPPEIKHQDQEDFLPKRHLRNNVKTILNVLEYYEAHLEKTFDNVTWQFLIEQIKDMELGMVFIKAVQVVYDKKA